MTAAGRREDPTGREAVRTGAPGPAPEFALDAWRRTCDAVNGAGLGTTVAALEAAGALQTLGEAKDPLAVSGWADRHDLHPAYGELAAFLLATQGWVTRTRDASGDWSITLTPAGRAWARHASVYAESIARLDLATELRARLSGEGKAEAPDWTALVRVDAAPGDEALATLLRRHARGPLLASVLGGLFRAGVLARLARGPFGWAAMDALELPEPLVAPCLRLLAEEGFVELDDDLARLTPAGRVAAQWAALDDYVVSYARVYRNVPALLGVRLPGLGEPGGDDTRDRHLLLYGKSFVLFQGVHTAIAEVVRPVFARPRAERPRFVLDPSAGDGSALVCVARVIADVRRETGGGRPLLFVGAAANALARARCEAGLRAEGVAFRVVEGEIADPDALAARLAGQGLDLRDALVVNKGSFHGRGHRGVGHERIAPRAGEPSSAVFVTPGHELVAPEAMEDDLAACFARWARWIPRHGLVVADTHTVDPAIAAASCRENALGHVLSSHGWSHQYLIEVECFRRAAARAGLRARVSVDLGSDRIARPTMSLEHLVPA